MKRRLLLTLIACFLALSSYASGTKIDGIHYWLYSSTKTAEVTYTGSSYYNNSYSGDITIPASVTYSGTTYSVTSIEDYAFYDCTRLTSLTIPSSVTSIGEFAFYKCTGLTSLTIPSSVTSIGRCAFQNCTGLTSINIPESVTSIGDAAFSYCTGLTSIKVEAGNTKYDSRHNCNAIIATASNTLIAGCKTTTIPSSVTSIGDYAFLGCTGLTSITIPSSVRSIGYYAFEDCTGLTSITIPSFVTSIKESTFEGCTGLTSITIPSYVKSIGKEAFYGCTGLTSITIPSSVTSIGEEAFYGCTGLTSITIPSSVTSIGSSAFNGCTSLTSITIPSSVTSIGGWAFDGCTGLTSITIPESVTYIGESAFRYCTGLTSITIPESVTSIGSRAFYGCTGLTSLTIPESVTSIGDFAFYECTGLTSITIPSSVTSIGNSAFYNCTGLTSISIPSSVTTIGIYAFGYCTGLTSITIPSSVTSIGDFAFYGCTGLTSITIPSYVMSIGQEAFYCCTGLTSVTLNSNTIASKTYTSSSTLSSIFGSQVKEYILGDEVTGIGSYAFYGCTRLTSVTIPSSVTSIGSSAFSRCTGLTSVALNSNTIASKNYTSSSTLSSIFGSQVKEYILGDEIKSIGSYAFRGSTGLTSITIPSSVTRIGNRAFRDCTGLTKVVINGGFYNRSGFTFIDMFGDQVEELTLGKDVTRSYANFEGCTNLTSVTIHSDNIDPSVFGSQVKKFTLGEGVTTIRQRAFFPGFPSGTGGSGELTFQPTALEEVYLPSTLRTIGNWAFQFCVNLKRIHFQEGLDSIGPGAFTYCLKLESLNLPASVRGFGEGQGWLLACKDITLDEANPYLTLQDGVLFNKEKTILLQYPAAREGESYRIPDGVKTVLGYSFEANSSLKSLTIPASVDSLGENCFAYTRLNEIRMESSVPPSSRYPLWYDNQGIVGSWLYPAYDFENSVTLYVPRGSKEIYAATAPWSRFTNIVEYDVTGIQPITLNPSEAGATYYNLQGQRIINPQRGQLVIVRNADGTSRKMLVQ